MGRGNDGFAVLWKTTDDTAAKGYCPKTGYGYRCEMTIAFHLRDSEGEILIKYYKTELENENYSPDDKRRVWERMKILVNGCSLECVSRMEKDRGLIEPGYSLHVR